MTTPLKIGVIGCGRVAQTTHLPLLARLPDVSVVALADADSQRLEQARRLAPQAQTFTAYRTLLGQSDAPAIFVTVPSGLHAEVATAVLESGRHLYLEKPMAANLDDARRLLTLWRRQRVQAMIGFNYRFNPLQAEAHKLLREGRIGYVLCVRTMFSDDRRELPAWLRQRQMGGGALLELGSHHFDLVPWLLGSPIRDVQANVHSQASEHDHASVNARLENGALMQSLFFFGSRQQDRIEIHGTKGWLVIDRFRSLRVESGEDAEGRLAQLKNALRPIARAPWLGDNLIAPPREISYERALLHFIECVRHDRPPSPDLADGFRSLAAVIAAEESSATGCTVTLPE